MLAAARFGPVPAQYFYSSTWLVSRLGLLPSELLLQRSMRLVSRLGRQSRVANGDKLENFWQHQQVRATSMLERIQFRSTVAPGSSSSTFSLRLFLFCKGEGAGVVNCKQCGLSILAIFDISSSRQKRFAFPRKPDSTNCKRSFTFFH